MRKQTPTLFLIATVISIICISVINGCTDSPMLNSPVSYCDTALCPNFSICDSANAVCICNAGYEQTVDSASGIMTCQEPRSKFLGLYVGGSTCTAAADSITITVSNSDITEVSITSLTTPSTSVGPVIATINGTSITIASQTVPSGQTVSGNGTLTVSSLSLQYTVMSAGGNSSCDFSGTKQ